MNDLICKFTPLQCRFSMALLRAPMESPNESPNFMQACTLSSANNVCWCCSENRVDQMSLEDKFILEIHLTLMRAELEGAKDLQTIREDLQNVRNSNKSLAQASERLLKQPDLQTLLTKGPSGDVQRYEFWWKVVFYACRKFGPTVALLLLCAFGSIGRYRQKRARLSYAQMAWIVKTVGRDIHQGKSGYTFRELAECAENFGIPVHQSGVPGCPITSGDSPTSKRRKKSHHTFIEGCGIPERASSRTQLK